ncbi:hypothetical protein [Idiomarina xiamenensis]|uniref:Uncharacterized protein n=1 Tax=Idiomarina xiamenensis 10-D-4 TaxID=740709 RepID=K2JKB1_9GAMM|nr:hypothetical protein [Idiomarina xiamenensis]EKE83901.1 hypothetical protein A10D4_07136 [Idiomarina xiamenensis 10-D-4]
MKLVKSLLMVFLIFTANTAASNVEQLSTKASIASACLTPDKSNSWLLADEAKRCCKVCRKGKACGDSCIARNKTCRKGAGCACDGGD